MNTFQLTTMRSAVFFFGLLALICCGPNVAHGQKDNKVTIDATVIGVEVPEMGWPMEFEDLKIFYLRVDRVEKGKLREKYLRVAYGHNPSSNRSGILPDEMFEGKFQWRFELSAWDDFDSKVSVSRTDGDWVDDKKSTKVKGTDLGLSGADAKKEFTSVPMIQKCVPVKGYEAEAISMESLGVLKGYWLSFENKKGYKKMAAIPSK